VGRTPEYLFLEHCNLEGRIREAAIIAVMINLKASGMLLAHTKIHKDKLVCMIVIREM
jgi:hypothetical protein